MPEIDIKLCETNKNNSKKIQIASSICSFLENIINKNEFEQITNQQNSLFYFQIPPKISLKEYIERLIKYTKLEESSLILSLIYLDKLTSTTNVVICRNNLHK
jgi:hypothetical protein